VGRKEPSLNTKQYRNPEDKKKARLQKEEPETDISKLNIPQWRKRFLPSKRPSREKMPPR